MVDKANSNSLMLQVQTPDQSWVDGEGKYHVARSFVYIPDGQDFIDRLYPALLEEAWRRDYDVHVFEIIQGHRPAKPCFDFDHQGGLPGCFADRADFQAKIIAAI